jgi:hypothetical protein
MQKLAGDPTWGQRAPAIIWIAVDRREIVSEWETLEEWDDGEN